MRFNLYTILTAIILFTGFKASAQTGDDPVIENIVTHVDKWLDAYQPEKVYLQTDKPYYAIGDDIWFKAYVTLGNAHHLSLLSGALNIELINENDSVKKWLKIPLNSGTALGDFALPDTLTAGRYRIRAYTNWMRNAGPDYYFDKVIAIGNPVATGANATTDNAKGTEKAIAKNKVDIQFFPESGNLVNGIRSTVAFKAVGPGGLGIKIKGIITDNESKQVSEFATQHLGMGVFDITPESGKTYKALITYADGSQNTVNLPAALNSGYVMSINNADSDNVYVKVTVGNGLPNAGHIYLYAQSGGETRYVAMSNATTNVFRAAIPKSTFPSGIVQFTLFSATGDPLNERVIFIQHNTDLLNLNISTAKTISAPREKVTINLDAQNSNGKPALGSFSASVIDESKVQTDEPGETTILSHILLTTDLRGYIEQPNYYFINNNDTARANLDILMLTQGYRRFEWKPLLAGSMPAPVYQPEKLIKLSGNVKTLIGGKPVAGAKVTLFTADVMSAFSLDTVTDKQGHFAFKELFLTDSIKFILQARTPKDGKNVTITLDDNGNEDIAVKNRYLPADNLAANQQLSDYLMADKPLYDEEAKYGLGNHSRVLNEVKVTVKRKSPIDFSDNINGPGHADQVVTSDLLEKFGCTDLTECLEGHLLGVIFRNGKPYLTSNSSILPGRDRAMEIILDGVPVDGFSSISPNDIGTIEVLRTITYTAIYGLKGSNGVLVLTTNRGSQRTSASIRSPGLIIYSPKGYYRAREFYSPQYDDPKTNKTIADLRTTIYWKPNIVTDTTGHASFEYYNAGSPGTYRITVEGIDADGNLGHKVYRYKVE